MYIYIKYRCEKINRWSSNRWTCYSCGSVTFNGTCNIGNYECFEKTNSNNINNINNNNNNYYYYYYYKCDSRGCMDDCLHRSRVILCCHRHHRTHSCKYIIININNNNNNNNPFDNTLLNPSLNINTAANNINLNNSGLVLGWSPNAAAAAAAAATTTS